MNSTDNSRAIPGMVLPLLSSEAAQHADVLECASIYAAEPDFSHPSWRQIFAALDALKCLSEGQQPSLDGW